MKKYSVIVGAVAILSLLAGCGSGGLPAAQNQNGTTDGNNQTVTPTTSADDTKDTVFSDVNTKVSFHYLGYLKPSKVQSAPGAVQLTLVKRPGSTAGHLSDVVFSTKTHDAWVAEIAAAKAKQAQVMCDSEAQFGCEKWDRDVAMYKKALQSKDYSEYYALGASKVVVNGITYIVTVSYNIELKQYQTTYTAYANDTRITFVDPATGGIEYGVPFSMNAKNRELVETIAKNLANRQRVDDVQTRARADELFTLVSSVTVAK